MVAEKSRIAIDRKGSLLREVPIFPLPSISFVVILFNAAAQLTVGNGRIGGECRLRMSRTHIVP